MERYSVPRTIAAGLGIVMGSTALVGCAHYEYVDTTEPATVIQHDYHPSYTSIIVISRGKYGTSIIPVFHPEQFGLEVRQCGKPEGENVDASGCINQEVTVTKDQYEQFKDGDTILLAHK